MPTQSIYDLVDAWNDAGITFTAIKMNVTDTASAAASLLMDLQVGSVSAFNVSKGGSIKLGLNRSGTNVAASNVTISAPQGTGTGAGGAIVFQVAPLGGSGATQNGLATALTIGSDRSTRLEGDLNFSGAGTVNITGNVNLTFTRSGAPRWVIGQDYIATGANAFIGFSSQGSDIGSLATNVDTRIVRDAANTLALRNGTNAQAFRVYGTFTDASNHRRLALTMSTAGVAEIKPEGAGTGASGNVLHISGLPTSNPGPGILWNNAGTPAIGT